MAMSPESVPENPVDFRAPPPSPIAPGRRSSVANEGVLTEFLVNSPRVPDLILPDKIFPRQKIVETPPRVDFQSLSSPGSESIPKVLDSVTRIGCFQLVNHGVPSEVIAMALSLAAGIFRISPERKAAVMRSAEKPYGFEEVHGREDGELNEEFVWCNDESLKLDMEAMWPVGYQNFSSRMETLLSDIEKVGAKILQVLKESNSSGKWMSPNEIVVQAQERTNGSICYIHRHSCSVPADQWASSLGYDVMRMLIRGTDHSHALALHICDGSSEFHVYSKKGWASFCPDEDAIVVTVGDQAQALSGGQYKHVLGRSVFRGEDEDSISIAVLYSPPSKTTSSTATATSSSKIIKKEKTVTLGQQALLVVILTLACQFLVYLLK